MARALALAGSRTVILARDPERLTEAATAIEADGGEAAWFSADLADRAAIADAAEEITEAHGEPDILVNCAGINLRPPLGELTEADWDLTMAVNLTAPFLLGQRRLRGVQGRPGLADPLAVRSLGQRRSLLQQRLPRVRPDPAQRAGG